MERDYFGFASSKNGAATMKGDAAAGGKLKGPAAAWGAGIQWSFSNKVSALPQLLSFKTTRLKDRSRKTILGPLSCDGCMTISTADAFVCNQKPFLGAVQKNLTIGKQGGNKHGMTLRSFDANSASPQVARIFSVSNQSNQASCVHNLATNVHNRVNSAIKPQSPRGFSHIGPESLLPTRGSIVGSTGLRNSPTGPRSQLTIFYAGSVCVYDDISPEKAQAVMLLAGNGYTPIQSKTVSRDKLQPPFCMPSKDDGFIISQSCPSPMPSPLSVIAHANFQPGGGSSSNNELGIMKAAGPLTTRSNHLESPQIGSVGSAATEMVTPVGLPQARKASLARFLEKRKERLMSTSPYHMSKKFPECSSSSTPGSDGVSFSVNGCSLPGIN